MSQKANQNVYKSERIEKTHPIVQTLLSLKEVKEFMEQHSLDFTSIDLNTYEEQGKKSISIPIKLEIEGISQFIIAFEKEDGILNAQVLTLNTTDGMKISFKDLNSKHETAGIYDNDFNLIKVENNGELKAQGVTECIYDYFMKLPGWLQAFCGGSCGSCIGGVLPGCAACAGCLGGNAWKCF
ncbi:hypothetical protein [Bacillus sp. MMSF_3353]|uniref:hypothetical protein n=1 Tax=Bacillus sp. MMSF_3353 TaxID=3047081 RepID=UPI00273FE73C|nr:hypothetical protein [Bacillus sp. MMSF_3353]